MAVKRTTLFALVDSTTGQLVGFTGADGIEYAIPGPYPLVQQSATPVCSTVAVANSATTGTNASVSLDVAVSPLAASTQVTIGERISVNYNSPQNITVGGYLMPLQCVINTSGPGTHDKMVGIYSQMNFTGGNITSAISFEPAIAAIGASTLIGGYAGYYFPNLAGVANISNIGTFACFSNDEPRALFRTCGVMQNVDAREISPSRSAGIQTGRYYTGPCGSLGSVPMAANVIYCVFVHIPRRCTPTKLGLNISTGAAGNCILGLYKVADNMLTTLVAQTASMSTAGTGALEGTVGTQVDSGTYAIVAVFSATPTCTWHNIVSCDMIGMSGPTNYSEQAYITPFTFGALPATANTVPTFAANTAEPHLWYRL